MLSAVAKADNPETPAKVLIDELSPATVAILFVGEIWPATLLIFI